MYPCVAGRSSRPDTFCVHCSNPTLHWQLDDPALHSQARTTHLIREEIRNSTLPQAELARWMYNVTRQTIRKWQNRESPEDKSHAPNKMYTTLTPEQELIVVELRKTLLLPTDDLLAVTREFINPAVSRAGSGRCLRRHGVSDLRNRSSRKALRPPRKRPSRTTSRALCTSTSSTCRRCPTRRQGAISSLPSTCYALGLHRALCRPDRWQQWRLPQQSPASLSRQDRQASDRQRQPVHRPLHGWRQEEGTQRHTRVRPPVQAARHRAPAHPASSSADQRHGGALQRSYQRHRQPDPFWFSCRTGIDAAQLRQDLQPQHSATRAPTQNTRSGAQGMA